MVRVIHWDFPGICCEFGAIDYGAIDCEPPSHGSLIFARKIYIDVGDRLVTLKKSPS